MAQLRPLQLEKFLPEITEKDWITIRTMLLGIPWRRKISFMKTLAIDEAV